MRAWMKWNSAHGYLLPELGNKTIFFGQCIGLLRMQLRRVNITAKDPTLVVWRVRFKGDLLS